MPYRLVVAGLALNSLSEPTNGDQWTSQPSPLEWDNLSEAASFALSESNQRDGQPVDVVDFETRTVQARVSIPTLAAIQGLPDALRAPLELSDDPTR